MSEFSESTHLRAGDVQEAVSALERAGLGGWVLPPASGWVTVVVDAPFGSRPDLLLAPAFDGVILHYLNAEDHGWGCWLHHRGEALSAYETEWTFDVEIDDGALDAPAMLAALAATGLEIDPGALEALLHPADLEAELEAPGDNPGHRFARLLGLPAFVWLAADGMAAGEEPGAIRVG